MTVARDPAETKLSPTARTRLRRYPERGLNERRELYAVLDAGVMCFVGAVAGGAPRVLPMVYGRIGDTLYLHGSTKNQALVAATRDGSELCVNVTHVDALVLANSLFHHSVNFRSAMIYGSVRVVTDPDERLAGLRAAANQLVPGRGDALPPPTAKQLKQTLVVALPLEEASVKVREGAPGGDPEDYETDLWSGVLPISKTWLEPCSDPKLRHGIPVPEHVTRLIGKPATI
jgi:nitroimidazol reductase NimA-like FMN-containing flavoprotein (pyridoxamine 5'-phosphate oxidase superfamily)